MTGVRTVQVVALVAAVTGVVTVQVVARVAVVKARTAHVVERLVETNVRFPATFQVVAREAVT